MPGALDIILGGLREALHGVSGAFGTCNACHENALPLACVICGERTCLHHAWFSGEVVTKRALPRVVCSLCVDDIEVDANEDGASGRWQRDAKPANVTRERREWARKVLGVTAKAPKKEITAAYRKRALKYHPDRNPGDIVAEAAFKQVAEAYRVLTGDEPGDGPGDGPGGGP